MKRRFRRVVVFGCFLFLCFCQGFSTADEDGFAVKRIGNIHPYGENSFRVTAPENGEIEIRLEDSICVYRTLRDRVNKGETTILWDGCGYNRERLYEKSYTITATLLGDSGKEYSVSFLSPVEYALQDLQYVLPSSDTLYTEKAGDWFIEYRTVTQGIIRIEVIPEGKNEPAFSYSVAVTGGKINRKDYASLSGKQIPEAGKYKLKIYEESRPEEAYTLPLTVAANAPENEELSVTGEIMPERGMTDAEIWDIMMKPSVVVDIDSFKHQDVYTEPNRNSASLGKLHGQSQGLQVFEIRGEWVRIGAWNHEEAEYVEGWVPKDRLKTVRPQREYGILIDKQKQTLSVYHNGEKIDELLISTGRAEKNSLYQETSAGCFLTGYHRVNFSMNGKKYDYVIQYDGGNLLHQTPYDWGQQKKDFTLGRGYLGAKASHACIRIQPEPGKGGVNAYWIFTHIPYHTRVIILDDPTERTAEIARLKRTMQEEKDITSLNVTKELASVREDSFCVTFTGSMIPGGTNAFNNRRESLAAFAEKNGYDKPLSKMRELFFSDDLTCAFLNAPIQRDDVQIPDLRNERHGNASSVGLIKGSGIDLLLCEDFLSNETAEIPGTDILEEGQTFVVKKQGHSIGLAYCSEKAYLRDPESVDLLLNSLEKKCDIKILMIHWNDSKDNGHSIVQEAMAHRGVRAGANLVIGNREGVLQGVAVIEGVPVIYSMGNLLDGSNGEKPKIQQGALVRAVFTLGENRSPSVTIIPIAPYGRGSDKTNEYMPDYDLKGEMSDFIFGEIRRDSTDAGTNGFSFYRPAP